jgi:hypothetical protein
MLVEVGGVPSPERETVEEYRNDMLAVIGGVPSPRYRRRYVEKRYAGYSRWW